MKIEGSLVRIRGPLMTSRMLSHVSIRESLEGAGGRLDAILALSLHRVDAASDLAPKLETTFSSHLQAAERVAAVNDGDPAGPLDYLRMHVDAIVDDREAERMLENIASAIGSAFELGRIAGEDKALKDREGR
jgi:hypothetical protein